MDEHPDSNEQLISDLARDLLQEFAPHEMPVFQAVSAAYFRDPAEALESPKSRGEMLGFGLQGAGAFLAPALLAIAGRVVSFLAEALQDSLKKSTTEGMTEVVRSMIDKDDPSTKKKPAGPVLSPEQLASVRKLVVEAAGQLEVPPAKIELLADAVAGRLAVSR